MLVYIVLLLVAIILLLANKYSKENALFLMLMMLIVCGLRDYNIGIDTLSYVDNYKYYSNENTSEFLFNYTYSLIHFIGGSGHLWLFFVSVLLFMPYIVAIKQFSIAPVISAFIFLASPMLFFFDSMNGIRQWTSGGLILLSFLYRNEREIIKCVICFVLAMGFHLSSIVALPFMFIWEKCFSYKIVVCSLIGITICSIVMAHFNLSSFFEGYSVLLDSMQIDADTRFAKYAKYGEMENTTNWKYYVVNILPMNLICLASYPSKVRNKGDNRCFNKNVDCSSQNGFLFNALFMGTILMNICSISIKYGHRIFFAVVALQLILLPRQYVLGNRNQKKWILALIVYMSVWFLYYINSINGQRIGSTVPYSFFF